jgi:hypothetical protein
LRRAKGCRKCCWRCETGQTGFETGQTGLGSAGGKFGFCAREESRFVSGGRGSGGSSGESACGQFARHSPSRAQYGNGKSRSFEMER